MSFFKSNTTTTTNATTNEANQETGNNNGGLLKGVAIAVGTVAGIGLAAFGGKKAYNHFHVKDENNMENVTVNDEEGSENVTENFNEVDTEEPANETPVAAEEAKTEETVNEAPAEEKKSVGETKTADTRNIEAIAKESVAKESLEKRLGNLIRLQKSNDADADKQIMRDIVMVDFNVETLRKLAVSDIHDIETVACRCGSLAIDHYIKHASSVIKNTNLDDQKNLINIRASLMTIKSVVDTLENIVIYPKTRVHLEKVIRFADVRENELFQIKLEKTMSTENKVVDETQATTEEVPNETQIGNSTVVSDDGETVTLTASVSQESIDNVNEVINIVSKIPNRENPELNDMAYFIRVIGGRIHGIKEPEATFIAYDEASNSNKFIDACTDVCNLVGKGICNLANSGKNPLTSMQWIDRCTNELVASGIIDNTYDPNKYRSAILKAHNEAMDKLSKLVSNENQVDTDKVTGETNTVTNDKLIDEINTYVHAINVMAFKDFTMVSTDSFVEKIHKIDECISLLNNSEPSKAIKRNAYKNINITVRLFCTSKLEDINACASRIDIVDLCADVRAMLSLNLTNVEINETTLNAINNAITSAQNKADEIAAKYETKDLVKTSDETQADASSSNENQVEEPLTYTMSEKIQEAVTDQQSDETAATAEPESSSQAPMSPEASNLAAKLQEVGALMRAEKWSDAAEFYKTQLTPYLADDGLTKELREEIMGIKTKATNMMMSQKQLEAKKKAASAKASKKSNKRRRH